MSSFNLRPRIVISSLNGHIKEIFNRPIKPMVKAMAVGFQVEKLRLSKEKRASLTLVM